MQFQLSCELSYRPGKPVVPNMLAKPPQKQQGGGQEEAEGEAGAAGALQNKGRTILTEQMGSVTIMEHFRIVLHATAVTAGRGGIPFYMTHCAKNTV